MMQGCLLPGQLAMVSGELGVLLGCQSNFPNSPFPADSEKNQLVLIMLLS